MSLPRKVAVDRGRRSQRKWLLLRGRSRERSEHTDNSERKLPTSGAEFSTQQDYVNCYIANRLARFYKARSQRDPPRIMISSAVFDLPSRPTERSIKPSRV